MIDEIFIAAIVTCSCMGILLLLFLIVTGFTISCSYDKAVNMGKELVDRLSGGVLKWMM